MKNTQTQILTLILSLVGLLALSGCGSSGTSSDHNLVGGNTAVKSPPYDITAHHESTVIVHCHATPSTEDQTHEWTQVSGPTIGLSTTTAPTTSLVVPTHTTTQIVSSGTQTTVVPSPSTGPITQPIVLQHTVTNVATKKKTTTTHKVVPIHATPALSVTVSTHLSVMSGMPASLHASVSGGDGQYSYIWTQTEGTKVTLDETHPSAPTFTAPAVSTTETFKFMVEVIDGEGNSASAIETVTIKSKPVTIEPVPDQKVGHHVPIGAWYYFIPDIVVHGNTAEQYNFQVKETSGLTPALPDLSITPANDHQSAYILFKKPDIIGVKIYTLEVTVTDSNNVLVGSITFNVSIEA